MSKRNSKPYFLKLYTSTYDIKIISIAFKSILLQVIEIDEKSILILRKFNVFILIIFPKIQVTSNYIFKLPGSLDVVSAFQKTSEPHFLPMLPHGILVSEISYLCPERKNNSFLF